jgi:iron complex transport system permease protein
MGEIDVTLIDLFKIFSGQSNQLNFYNVIINYRLPKIVATILTGIALPTSGFLMQELFKNPLAGPSVFGISSAAGLGVAMFIFVFSSLGYSIIIENSWAMIFSAFIGALLGMFVVGFFAWKINSTVALIIIGFMIASFVSSILGVLEYFSVSDKIKSYVVWSFGSMEGLSWGQLSVYFLSVILGVFSSLFAITPLKGLLLGNEYASTMGININKLRLIIFFSTSILVASSTAFTGPIAFIGLAIPHLCRTYWPSANLFWLFLMVNLTGILAMLFFVFIAQLFPNHTLPINIITSLFGAPIIVSIIWNRKNLFV